GVLVRAVPMNDRGIEAAVGLLRRIGNLDLGEVKRDLIHGHDIAGRPAKLMAGYNQIVELDFEVFLLLLARFAASQESFLHVRAGGAMEEKLRGRLVGPHAEREVLHGDLAGAAATAAGVRPTIGFSP